MGQDIRLKSKKIYNAYLSLGLLEIAREINPNQRVSQQNIFDEMPLELSINDVSDIRDYINSAKKWLKDAELNDDEIDFLINTSSKGTKILNDIPERIYNDLIAGFLLLNLIEDKNHTELIKNTFDHNIEKSLSIITKLTIAKTKHDLIVISLIDNLSIINFIPRKFKFHRDEWSIVGENITEHDPNYEINLNNISKIIYDVSPI